MPVKMVVRVARLVFILISVASPGRALAASYTMDVVPVRPDGVFRAGEEVAFRLAARRNGGTIAGQQMSYTIKTADGVEVAAGSVTLTGGPALVKAKVEGPTVVTCVASYSTANISDSEAGTAIVAPELFKASQPPPEDFDAFWQAQRQLLISEPPEVDVQPAAAPQGADPVLKQAFNQVAVFDVAVQGIDGVAAPLRGHMARPKNARAGSLPAILYPQTPGPRMVRGAAPQRGAPRPRPGQPMPPPQLTGDPGRAVAAAKLGMLAMSSGWTTCRSRRRRR